MHGQMYERYESCNGMVRYTRNFTYSMFSFGCICTDADEIIGDFFKKIFIRCGSSEWIIALLTRIATVQSVSDSRLWLSVVPWQLKLPRAEEVLAHQEAV